MTDRLSRLAAALADRYTIERELGAGGMATVYLAQDLKHDRKVALKVLKPELAAVLGAERFVVEIKTTAALQHPHILPLFDSGTADGFLYYVMPYVEGETLRDQLNRETQLGIEEAVRITREVADALDYAHRHGVIHRDIKPENILLHDGRPMVADFGIALAVSAAAGGRMTETGLSLGTPHYMSPEQATAEKDLTSRSDIYSLGSVLYEMLTGHPPHVGASAQQIIMKIVTEEAAPVTATRKSVPPNVAAAVAKALEKLPADRFGTAKAFADALADQHFVTPSTGIGVAAIPGRPSWRGWLRDPRSWAALLAIGALISWTVVAPSGRPPGILGPETIRFTITGPGDSSVLALSAKGDPVVSPDGRHVAFSVFRPTGSSLYLRPLDAFDLTEVAGEGDSPFFSPDGASLGFFRGSEIWKLALAEGVPTKVGAIPEPPWDLYPAVWHPDGRILIGGASGLWSIAARGGEPTLLVSTDSAGRERFEEPGLLPDGRILLNVTTPTAKRIEVLSPDATERIRLAPGLEDGRVVGDILFFTRSGQVQATRFDLRRLEPIGEAITVTEIPPERAAPSIAWVEEDGANREVVWVSRDGRVTPLGVAGSAYRWPRISPEGGRIALGQDSWERPLVSVVALGRRTVSQLAGFSEPVWSTDGRYVFMSAAGRPRAGLVTQVADGSRPPDTVLMVDAGDSWPTSVSPDGAWLAYYGATFGAGSDADANDPNDLFFVELATRESRRVRLPGAQRGARFSPDGRWVAYQSTESGSEEVHVRPWPAMDANYRVSNGGGYEPAWSPDGRELYYRHQDRIMVVTISTRGGVMERAPPRLLFVGPFFRDPFGDQSYDVARDGRFLMLRAVPGARVSMQVALNWIADVRARLDRAR